MQRKPNIPKMKEIRIGIARLYGRGPTIKGKILPRPCKTFLLLSVARLAAQNGHIIPALIILLIISWTYQKVNENVNREDEGTGEVCDNIPIDIEDG